MCNILPRGPRDKSYLMGKSCQMRCGFHYGPPTEVHMYDEYKYIHTAKSPRWGIQTLGFMASCDGPQLWVLVLPVSQSRFRRYGHDYETYGRRILLLSHTSTEYMLYYVHKYLHKVLVGPLPRDPIKGHFISHYYANQCYGEQIRYPRVHNHIFVIL